MSFIGLEELINTICPSAWLIDALREWGKNNYYHGFDISHEQFPQGVENISFSTHDITVPFPKEHLNRYDIVHVRLLIAALNESKYRKAVANVYALLSISSLLYHLSTWLCPSLTLPFLYSSRARWLDSMGGS